MATRFLGIDAWKRIRALNKRRGQRLVAVPYLGENASRRLTLKVGDLLVVRLDLATVKAGQTSPKDILAYVKRGVEVHKQSNLHAKVFVFGDAAVIGSTNVSASSEGTLLEAAVETTAPSVVASAKRFVRSLRGDVVTPQEAKRLQKFYQRPKGGRAGRPSATPEVLKGSGHSMIWAVPLLTGVWVDDDYEASEKETPIAQKKLRNTRYFSLDEFVFAESRFARTVRLGDRVLQIVEERGGRTMVTAPGRVIRKCVYGTPRNRRTLVFLELRKTQRRKAFETVCSRLGPLAQPLEKQRGPKRLKDPALLYQLGQLWRSDDSR